MRRPQRRVAGEQHQGAALQAQPQVGDQGGHRRVVVGVVVGGDVAGHHGERLAEEVEGRAQHQLGSSLPHPGAPAHEVEGPGHGEGRRGQNHRVGGVEEAGAEPLGDVHRGLVELRLLGAQLDPGDVAGARAEHDPLHHPGGVVECGGGELELVVEAVGLGQEGVLEDLAAAGVEQCRGGAAQGVTRMRSRPEHGGEARVVADVRAQADGGVARVVDTEQLAEEALELAEESGGSIPGPGQRGLEVATVRAAAEPVEHGDDVGGAQPRPQLLGGRLL